MGHYRARDLLLVPSLLSFLRLPLALAFASYAHRPLVAVLLLALAGLTDVLDGWYARKYGQATATGAVVDGVLDKLFAALVVGSLVAHHVFAWYEALLLVLREIGELPLVVWWALHRDRRKARAEDPKANAVGKLATVAQFFAITAALFQSPLRLPGLVLAAALGVVAVFVYWRRELGAVRPRPG